MRRSVDLPQPDGPTKTTNSPSLILQIDVLDDGLRSEILRDRFTAKPMPFFTLAYHSRGCRAGAVAACEKRAGPLRDLPSRIQARISGFP